MRSKALEPLQELVLLIQKFKVNPSAKKGSLASTGIPRTQHHLKGLCAQKNILHWMASDVLSGLCLEESGVFPISGWKRLKLNNSSIAAIPFLARGARCSPEEHEPRDLSEADNTHSPVAYATLSFLYQPYNAHTREKKHTHHLLHFAFFSFCSNWNKKGIIIIFLFYIFCVRDLHTGVVEWRRNIMVVVRTDKGGGIGSISHLLRK
jgi:hypothetical protein